MKASENKGLDETLVINSNYAQSIAGIMTRLQNLESRPAKDEQNLLMQQLHQRNDALLVAMKNQKHEMGQLQSRMSYMETTFRELSNSILQHQDTFIPLVEKEISQLAVVMEDRENTMKADVGQVIDQIADKSASMIEGILQDLAVLSDRLHSIEVSSPQPLSNPNGILSMKDKLCADHLRTAHANIFNGSCKDEADDHSSDTPADSNLKKAARSQHTVKRQGSQNSLQTLAESKIPQDISQSLSQSFNVLTAAIDRAVCRAGGTPPENVDKPFKSNTARSASPIGRRSMAQQSVPPPTALPNQNGLPMQNGLAPMPNGLGTPGGAGMATPQSINGKNSSRGERPYRSPDSSPGSQRISPNTVPSLSVGQVPPLNSAHGGGIRLDTPRSKTSEASSQQIASGIPSQPAKVLGLTPGERLPNTQGSMRIPMGSQVIAKAPSTAVDAKAPGTGSLQAVLKPVDVQVLPDTQAMPKSSEVPCPRASSFSANASVPKKIATA